MLTVSLLIEFDEVNRRILRSAAGIDIQVSRSAPRQQFSRVDLNFDGSPALCGYVVGQLLNSVREGIVIRANGNVGTDPTIFSPIGL